MRGSSKKRRSSQRQHSATDGSAENIILRLGTYSRRVQLLMVPGSCDQIHLSLKDAFGGHLW